MEWSYQPFINGWLIADHHLRSSDEDRTYLIRDYANEYIDGDYQTQFLTENGQCPEKHMTLKFISYENLDYDEVILFTEDDTQKPNAHLERKSDPDGDIKWYLKYNPGFSVPLGIYKAELKATLLYLDENGEDLIVLQSELKFKVKDSCIPAVTILEDELLYPYKA